MTGFQRAFAGTAGLLTALSLASTAGRFLDLLYLLWMVGAFGWIVLLGLGITFIFFKSDRLLAAGILAGWAVGFLALTVSCFVNLTDGSIYPTQSGAQQPMDKRFFHAPRQPAGGAV